MNVLGADEQLDRVEEVYPSFSYSEVKSYNDGLLHEFVFFAITGNVD